MVYRDKDTFGNTCVTVIKTTTNTVDSTENEEKDVKEADRRRGLFVVTELF